MGENGIRNFQIGANIRKIREFRGYSQDYVAAKLDMSQQNYSKIERGELEFNEDKLKSIAEVLEVNPGILNDLDDKSIFNYNVLNDQSQVHYTSNGHVYNHFPAELREYYENKIKSLEEQIKKLEEKKHSSI